MTQQLESRREEATRCLLGKRWREAFEGPRGSLLRDGREGGSRSTHPIVLIRVVLGCRHLKEALLRLPRRAQAHGAVLPGRRFLGDPRRPGSENRGADARARRRPRDAGVPPAALRGRVPVRHLRPGRRALERFAPLAIFCGHRGDSIGQRERERESAVIGSD